MSAFIVFFEKSLVSLSMIAKITADAANENPIKSGVTLIILSSM